jgi:hypothetical protein
MYKKEIEQIRNLIYTLTYWFLIFKIGFGFIVCFSKNGELVYISPNVNEFLNSSWVHYLIS